jgi:predicted RNase H-like HicB family nuclease
MRYAVVIEKGGENYAAYVPHLPGCIVTSVTVEDVEVLNRQAIELHIGRMTEDGLAIPPGKARVQH